MLLSWLGHRAPAAGLGQTGLQPWSSLFCHSSLPLSHSDVIASGDQRLNFFGRMSCDDGDDDGGRREKQA